MAGLDPANPPIAKILHRRINPAMTMANASCRYFTPQ